MSVRWIFPVIVLTAMAAAGCNRQQRDISSDLAEARRYISEGNDVKAGVVLQHALQARPLDAQANLLLAGVEDRAGNLQDAVPHYLQAAAVDNHLLEPQLRIIQILLDSNRLAEASGRINATLGSFPNNPDALALRADLAGRQGQFPAAVADARNALAKDPANARALAVLALADLHADNVTDALKQIGLGLARHPDDLRLLQVQAAALLTADQPEKAEQALQTIVQRSPRNVAAQVALANLQARNGDLPGALAGFRTAVAANPQDTDLQLAFAKFIAERQSFGEAVSYFNDLVRREPDSSIYDLALAGLYRSKNQLDQSQAVLEKAEARLRSSKSKELASIEVALARIDVQRGRNDLALAQLNAVLAGDASNADALLLRAQLSLQDGRAQAAVTDLLAVVKDYPANGPAFRVLAEAFLAENEPKLAIDAMKRAVAVAAGDIDAELELAGFLQHARDVQGARELMSRLTLQHPGDTKVWVAEAEIDIDRKDWSAAGRAIKRLEELPDGAPSALAVQGQMQVAKGDYAGGMQLYAKALGAPNDIGPELLKAFARAAAVAGQEGQAAEQLTQLIPSLKEGDRQYAWLAAMALQMRAGHADKADAAFAQAVALAPSASAAYSSYVDLLVEKKDFDRARQVVAAGLEKGAPRPALLLLKGFVDLSSGNADAALADYREALDADPLSLAAANNYASLVVDREPKNLALLKDLRTRLNGAESSADPDVVDTIAWLDFRLGRFDEAKTLLTRIKAGESQNPQVRFHMAAVLLATGDKSGGSTLLDTVKGLSFPGSDEVQALSAT